MYFDSIRHRVNRKRVSKVGFLFNWPIESVLAFGWTLVLQLTFRSIIDIAIDFFTSEDRYCLNHSGVYNTDHNFHMLMIICVICAMVNCRCFCRYFWSKVNVWTVNCAWATAFIFDTRTDVLVKVSKFLRQKISRPDRKPSDSCRML